METYAIPLEDAGGAGRFIVYRPLVGLAFVGNRAMADLALAAPPAAEGAPMEFLRAVGALEPDPPPPGLPGAEFRPTTAVLLLTNQCPLRCTYCYAAAGELPRQALTVELGQAAIDHVCETAQALGRPHFEVSFHGGGEPTAAWSVLEACAAYARRRPLPARLTLTSNGVWTARQRDWIFANLDGLSLSLDGAPETQDRQRPFASGQGSSARVMATVAALDRRGFPYGIRLTATAPWASLADDVRFLCAETGCQSMQVEPAFNTTRGGHGLPDEAEARAFAAAFVEAWEIANRARRRLMYSGARVGTATATFCTAPFGALIVNGLGQLVTCYEVSGPGHRLAGLSTIGRIEGGRVEVDAAARARLHALMAGRRSACRDCFCYWSCAGDCYTRTFMSEPDGHQYRGARCLINRIVTRHILLTRIAEAGGVWRLPRPAAAALTL